MASPISYDLQGQGGGVVLNAGDSYTGGVRWIQVINDAVLGLLISDNIVDADTKLASITLPAGLGFGGKFVSISVTSGVVIAYFE